MPGSRTTPPITINYPEEEGTVICFVSYPGAGVVCSVRRRRTSYTITFQNGITGGNAAIWGVPHPREEYARRYAQLCKVLHTEMYAENHVFRATNRVETRKECKEKAIRAILTDSFFRL